MRDLRGTHAGAGVTDRVLAWVLLPVMAVSLYMIFLWAPTERVMGAVQRIFYVHMAAAWVTFLAFFVVFVAGIAYLRTRERRWDVLGVANAEIGVLFCFLTIVTGSIWAKPVWGVWWTWDPQLTTTAVLWFIYVGYLIVRGAAADDARGARFAAVIGIAGFLDVPLVIMSARLMRGISPVVISRRGVALEPAMTQTLLACLVAFTLLYALLVRSRVALEALRDEVEHLRAGAAP